MKKIFCLLIIIGLQITMSGCKNMEIEKISVMPITFDEVLILKNTPKIGNRFYWQLEGSLETNIHADVIDIDLFDTEAGKIQEFQESGMLVVCYFSAGSYESWRSNNQNIPKDAIGKVMDGWEDENWIDIRNAGVWNYQKATLEFARDIGCDGVEPDNVDGYQNDTGFEISEEDQITFNKNLAEYAHSLGLFIGLKNSPDLVDQLVDYFDFALAEECWKYHECDKYELFIEQEKPVFAVEYDDGMVNDENNWNKVCNILNEMKYFVLLLPIELDGSWQITC